jgi:phosphatidylserine/phosphatidylglycerophosphate/cardiolipin synthase-like enzyme
LVTGQDLNQSLVHRHPRGKFVVVDDQIALVSSANLVTASFTTTGGNGVVVTHQADVDVLARLFTRLWQLSQWDMPPDARHPGFHGSLVVDRPEPYALRQSLELSLV